MAVTEASWDLCLPPVVRYEDLVEDTRTELGRMLAFLGRNASRATLECALANREGPYHRQARRLPFDPFDRIHRRHVGLVADRVYRNLGLPRPPRSWSSQQHGA